MSEPELLIMDEPTNVLDPILQNEVYSLIQETTKHGTTIFMSSHNLAEVDKVCSRVGVIRQGKLVATESIQALKEKHLYTIRMHLKKGVAVSAIKIEGAEVLHHHNQSIALRVKGDINPVVKKLAAYDLKDVEIEHAPLEDIFLEFYHS